MVLVEWGRADEPDLLTVITATVRSTRRNLPGPAAPGSHAVRWDERGAATGTYFAILRSGSETAVWKLLLLK